MSNKVSDLSTSNWMIWFGENMYFLPPWGWTERVWVWWWPSTKFLKFACICAIYICNTVGFATFLEVKIITKCKWLNLMKYCWNKVWVEMQQNVMFWCYLLWAVSHPWSKLSVYLQFKQSMVYILSEAKWILFSNVKMVHNCWQKFVFFSVFLFFEFGTNEKTIMYLCWNL